MAIAPLLGSLALLGAVSAPRDDAGARGASHGLAILAAKALTVPMEGPQVVDDAVLLVRDGRIEAIGARGTVAIPPEYELVDLGDRWVAPGLIDLHCHIASENFFVNDLNDMLFLTNPGLRACAAVVPGNRNLKMAAAGGVTSVLYIPGSGTNMGGQGVLLKTALPSYERMQIRNPGSLKLAQAGNPEGWTIGVGRSFMNWNTRHTFRRGLAYAQRWEDAQQGTAPPPDRDIQFDVFRDLLSKATQVSTHTQIYQVVLMTITMVRQGFGLDVFIDHGSFDGWRAAPLARKEGVPAILGPRAISAHFVVEYRPNMFIENDTDGAIFGIAAKYQEAGVELIGFNTDAPVIPEEELHLQAAMGARYGFDTSAAQHVRGLTIVPATVAGIANRVGSLEAGKDADFVVTDGDPADPRTTIFSTWIEGQKVYDGESEARSW